MRTVCYLCPSFNLRLVRYAGGRLRAYRSSLTAYTVIMCRFHLRTIGPPPFSKFVETLDLNNLEPVEPSPAQWFTWWFGGRTGLLFGSAAVFAADLLACLPPSACVWSADSDLLTLSCCCVVDLSQSDSLFYCEYVRGEKILTTSNRKGHSRLLPGVFHCNKCRKTTHLVQHFWFRSPIFWPTCSHLCICTSTCARRFNQSRIP
jgi:hypothetical protein